MAKILLVDDDEEILELITLRLEIAGHTVSIAKNGKIGVEKTFNGSFDLVLMDMHMPVMSGHAAVKSLRESGYTGLIIAITASAMASQTKDALSSGCNDVIIKPISDQFENQIATYINTKDQQ